MTHSIRGLKYLLIACFSMMLALPCLAAVDINKADATAIAKELKGVGATKAKAIVDYRTKNGAFKSVDELLKVSGIGEKLLLQNRSNIVLGSAEPAKK
jgi:competence protein ComEA